MVESKLIIVIFVLAIILVGIFVYLFFMDRKIRRLEKEVEEKLRKGQS